MEAWNLGCQDWLFAVVLVATNLKSMKLQRELSVTQRTAWHTAHRIRKALGFGNGNLFKGSPDLDETYMEGRCRKMPNSKRKELTGRGPGSTVALLGIRGRDTNHVSAQVVGDTTSETLQDLAQERLIPGTSLYWDESTAHASPTRDLLNVADSNLV